MRLLTALLAAAVVVGAAPALRAAEEAASQEEKPPEERVAHILIRSGDVLRGTDLTVTEQTVQVNTPHSGPVAADRRVVAGIAFGPGHDDEILEASGERDVLHITTGDKVSGHVVATADGALVVKTFYAGGKESHIALDTIDYLMFAPPAADEALELKPDPVRVIFANSDVVGGRLVGFRNGTFRLETQYAGTLEFKTDQMHSLHNTAKSRQFYPGGLAQAFLELFEGSGELQRNYRQLLPSLVRGLLSQGDTKGAFHVLERMARYDIDPWTYQQLAEAFEGAEQPDSALICYERMFEQRSRTLHVFRQLYEAYTRLGRHARAAEIYEELLKQPAGQLASYGFKVPVVHLALAKTYDKLEDYEKEIGHLRKVMDDPTSDADMRQRARAALVSTFSKIGQLDDLIAKYLEQIGSLDEQLGADHLTLVREYIDRGKFAKARLEIERLRALGLDEYVAKAQTLLDQAGGTGSEDETTANDDEDEDDARPQ